MNKPRLTKRQQYYTKAHGLPLFGQFDRYKYVDWIKKHQKEYLKSIGQTEIKGIEEYEKFDDYLCAIADMERSKL